MTAILKNIRRLVPAIRSLLGTAVFAFLVSGCAEAYYANIDASRTLEARYNTYYAPYYYPYYPWYGYYGDAYYHGE